MLKGDVNLFSTNWESKKEIVTRNTLCIINFSGRRVSKFPVTKMYMEVKKIKFLER